LTPGRGGDCRDAGRLREQWLWLQRNPRSLPPPDVLAGVFGDAVDPGTGLARRQPHAERGDAVVLREALAGIALAASLVARAASAGVDTQVIEAEHVADLVQEHQLLVLRADVGRERRGRKVVVVPQVAMRAKADRLGRAVGIGVARQSHQRHHLVRPGRPAERDEFERALDVAFVRPLATLRVVKVGKDIRCFQPELVVPVRVGGALDDLPERLE
jgi:hypothetical protein